MNLKTRRLVGSFSRLIGPSYTYCLRCGRTWAICDPHATMYTPSNGYFCLCEDCWGETNMNEKEGYYFESMAHGHVDAEKQKRIISALWLGQY